ncbi:MAG TPA: hypothetical protein VMF90_22260 [Rhizobiaceae bacterium]|nr:hypothetical protein [Rhizobiaceae bacterium]
MEDEKTIQLARDLARQRNVSIIEVIRVSLVNAIADEKRELIERWRHVPKSDHSKGATREK